MRPALESAALREKRQRGPQNIGARIPVPFRSPSPLKPSYRAKEQRNHNPRVGGSSPSSGMRSACKRAIYRIRVKNVCSCPPHSPRGGMSGGGT